MKTKLLKKVRKRFKWEYKGSLVKPIHLYWNVFDSKGTKPVLLLHRSIFFLSDGIRIHCPTIAEQLCMKLMGAEFVWNHRERKKKRMNKSFKKKHFNS